MKGWIQYSKVAVVVPFAILAHISYDIYAAYNERGGSGLSIPSSLQLHKLPSPTLGLAANAVMVPALLGGTSPKCRWTGSAGFH